MLSTTAKELLKQPRKLLIPLGRRGYFNWLPDDLYLKMIFYAEMGKKLDLENPKTINEKIQWLKIHDREPLYHTLVDKVEVKKYIADRIGEQYIIPTLGVWNTADEVPFDQLPSRFVLKCSHDSGSVIICHDKSTLDIKAVKASLNRCLKRDFYWIGREWPYKGVKPRILAEALLEGKNPGGIVDYKVSCFHGEPKFIEVHTGRMTANHTQDFYTPDWEWTEIDQFCEPRSSEPIPAPQKLEHILEFSRILSSGFLYMRVDWYELEGTLYFGELTFHSGSGFCAFRDEKWDYIIGEWLHLPLGEGKNT